MFRLLTMAAAFLASAAWSDDGRHSSGPVVVELFTSQGCSACPAADRLLHELAEHEEVLALSLHVDYWDYIGWEDAFADPAHTKRQKAYAAKVGERMIYTPQMVVQGVERVVGTRPGAILQAVGAHMDGAGPVALTVLRHGATVEVEARAAVRFDPPALVQLVRYAPSRTAAITDGENAGHRLDYVNVVTEWVLLAEWDGAAPLSLSRAAPGEDRVAVLVQEPGPGAVLAAARPD
jgi:hypothetical protein